jgi:phasin family protein
MIESIQTTTEDFQKASKDNYDAMLRSYGELNEGFQALAKRWTEFSKQSLEDATRAWEQMIAAKSLEEVFEIQSNYAKTAYDNWMAEMSKMGKMYKSTATDAYKQVEEAVTKNAA